MASAAETALERLSIVERPVRLAIEVVLVVVLALLLARLTWIVISPSESVANYTQRPLPAPMRGTQSSLAISTDRTVLVTENPFSQNAVEEQVQDVPETNLNLKLDGLRMSTEGGESGNAIIRTPDGRGKNYSVGDDILPGVTLERILSDRVIINRDGADETLMLGGRGAGLSVITDDSQTTNPEALAVEPVEDSSQASGAPVEGQLPGPDVFFGAVNAGPVMTNGQIIGYRLSPIGSADTMRQAGLEPGDILLRIDGNSVAELDLSDVIDRISEIQAAELRINRNGTEQTVRLRFGE